MSWRVKGDDGWRDATEREIREAQADRDEMQALMLTVRRLEKEAKDLKDMIGNRMDECDHSILRQTSGFIYDEQECLKCGWERLV